MVERKEGRTSFDQKIMSSALFVVTSLNIVPSLRIISSKLSKSKLGSRHTQHSHEQSLRYGKAAPDFEDTSSHLPRLFHHSHVVREVI